MATFFRLVQARWAASAMSGEGARLAGGRWNPPGLSAVYLAESRSLAALEVLVHAPRELLRLDWRILEVAVPDELVEDVRVESLPGDWRNLPSSVGARRLGEAWLREGGQLALRLPSTIIPKESVCLVNPLHASAVRMTVGDPIEFRFDPRI